MGRWDQAYTQVVKSHRGTGKGRVHLAYWRMDEGLYAWTAWRGQVALHGTAPSPEEAQTAAYAAAVKVKVPEGRAIVPLYTVNNGPCTWFVSTVNELHAKAEFSGFKLEAWGDGTWEVTGPDGKVTWNEAKSLKTAQAAAEKALRELLEQLEP
jgi:hypothetical protein